MPSAALLVASTALPNRNDRASPWDRRDSRAIHWEYSPVLLFPLFWDPAPGDWQKLAWVICDHLPLFQPRCFPQVVGGERGWREESERRIDNYANPVGYLTAGMRTMTLRISYVEATGELVAAELNGAEIPQETY